MFRPVLSITREVVTKEIAMANKLC